MTIITDQQLLTFCQQSAIQLPNYSQISATTLQVLLATGCRPTEAVSLDRWTLLDDLNYELQPLKGNNPRTIDHTTLPPLFNAYFTGGSQEYGLATISKANQYFKHTWPTFQLYNESKAVELYCYRYNFVKQLVISGYTFPQITDIMGWKASDMAARYASAVLYQIT